MVLRLPVNANGLSQFYQITGCALHRSVKVHTLSYWQALNTEHWSEGEPTDSEKDFWEIAAMEAYSHLTEWKSLQYCSTVYIDENSPPNLDRMWSEPLYQVIDLNFHSPIVMYCTMYAHIFNYYIIKYN